MMAEVDSSRDEVYGMLAELFIKPPDAAMLSTLLPTTMTVDVDALGAEFTEAFRGLRQGSPPPPYESLYREGVLFGETTQQVIESYKSYDVEPTGVLAGEPPDHIAFELDFMRHLIGLEVEAKDEGELLPLLMDEREFLEGHLLAWIDDLGAKLESLEGSGFYRQIVAFAREWMESDRQHLLDRLTSMEVVD
jgi:TorA maturation chaperone TorD